MSKAVKCDRCGCCYDPCHETKETFHADRWLFQDSESLNDCRNRRMWTDVDLCPECTEELILFMEGNQLRLHENDFDRPESVMTSGYISWDREEKKPDIAHEKHGSE